MTVQTIDNTVTDAGLMTGVAAADESSLAALYDRHHLVAFRVALRIVRDHGRAEDVVQEAFLSVWRKGASYSGDRGSVKSWLLGIVRNRAIDSLRSQRGSDADDEAVLLSIEDGGRDVLDEVAARLEGEAIRTALGKLPPGQRQAIAIAFFGERSHAEIAATTGLPLGTVHGRIRLGMRRLRAYLLDAGIGSSALPDENAGIGAMLLASPPSPQHGTA